MFMGKLDIPVGKSRHSVWEAIEKMGCDLRRMNFPTFLVCSADLDIIFSGPISHLVKFKYIYAYAAAF